MARNSILRLCRNIKLDRGYNNCLTYSEEDMRDLCIEHTIAMANNFSFLRDNENSVQVPFSYSTCMQANYMCFENPRYMNKWFFAFIDSVEYVSDSTTRINFTIDIFSTWFSYWSPTTCYVVREHVNDDTPGLHTIDEGLNGGEFVVNQAPTKLQFFSGFKPVMAVSQLVSASEFRDVPAFYENGSVFSGQAHIVADGGVTMTSNVLSKYDELGQADAVQNIFMCPIEIINACSYTAYDYGTNLKYLLLKTGSIYQTSKGSITRPTSLDGYTPVNKKLLTSPYNYLLFDNNNGSAVKFEYENFTDPTNISFACYGILTPGCSIKFVPANYHNSNYLESITAGKIPICNWNSDVYTNWLTQNGVNLGVTTLNRNEASGLGAITSLVTAVGGSLIAGATLGVGAGALALGGGLISTVSNVFDSMQSDYKASITPDQIKGNQNIGDINFSLDLINPLVYKMCIKSEKAKMIDDFFTRFGYKVNALKVPNQTGRRYFNFVQISNGEVIGFSKSDKTVPAEAMQQINNIFQKGVTLWHNHDRIGNYTGNTIL